MTSSNAIYLNVGIYTVPEASRLTGVSKERIRRWLRGYRSNLRKKSYSALWRPQLPELEGKVALGFLDLIEVRNRQTGKTRIVLHGDRERQNPGIGCNWPYWPAWSSACATRWSAFANITGSAD